MTPSAPGSILPPLSADEAEHSAAVAELIRRRIADAGGWISLESFMDLALYAPGMGYYSAGSAKLGAAGDFTTAPEMSALFSRCVARQCQELLQVCGGGEILELGAGTGRMAADILTELEVLGCLPERYAILEVSAELRERQQKTLSALPASLQQRVTWLDRLPTDTTQGLVLANEVLDALPVHRFAVRADGITEIGVAVDQDGRFIEQEAPAARDVASAWAQIAGELREPPGEGYRSELCLRVAPWIAAITQHLERGAVLLFDYGLPRAHYYHPQRNDGTLRCHFKHRAHNDPLVNVGVQDITAWVDFTRVAEAALAAGWDVAGFATQAAFLLGAGIASLADESADIVGRTRFASEARRLLMPGEMGEAFKAMALTRNIEVPLRGFQHQDLRHSL